MASIVSQNRDQIFEDALEPTVGVDDNNIKHAKLENYIIHEKFRKMFCLCFRINSRYYKLR